MATCTTYQQIFFFCLTIIACIGVMVAILSFIGVQLVMEISHPTMPKLHVTDASLSQFDLSTTNYTISYNLSLNMSLRNPSKHIELFYNPTQVSAYYKEVKFAQRDIPAIHLPNKEEQHMISEFVGQSFISLNHKLHSQYDSEKKSGIYRIDLIVDTHIRSSLGWSKHLILQSFECHLKVPMVFNGNASSSFVTTECDFY